MIIASVFSFFKGWLTLGQLSLCPLWVGSLHIEYPNLVCACAALVEGRWGWGGSIALFSPEMQISKAESESEPVTDCVRRKALSPWVSLCVPLSAGSHGNCVTLSQLLLISPAINGVRTGMKGRMPWCTASQLATPTQSGSGAGRRTVCSWWVGSSLGLWLLDFSPGEAQTSGPVATTAIGAWLWSPF